MTLNKILAIAEILETDLTSILNFDAKNVFYQTNNTNSVITGYNTNQYLNGNIENVLSRIQDDIQSLKNELNSSKF